MICSGKIMLNNGLVKINFPSGKSKGAENIRLSGAQVGTGFTGTGLDNKGKSITWTASFSSAAIDSTKGNKKIENNDNSKKI